MEEVVNFSWKDAAVKVRSKREIYQILTMKGKYYLPPESQSSSDFIHDTMLGKKKVSQFIKDDLSAEAKGCWYDICSSNKRSQSQSDPERSKKICWYEQIHARYKRR